MSKKVTPPKAKVNNSKKEWVTLQELKRYPAAWYYACAFLYLIYCYAAFFPTGPVWGIHFIGYIPIALRLVLLVGGGLLLVPDVQELLYRKVVGFSKASAADQTIRWVSPAIVAVVAFILFRSFTLKTDIYGDTINMLKWYGSNSAFDWSWIAAIFSPHVVENKEALTVALHRLVSYVFSASMESSYRTVSEICGGLYIFVWLVFVQKISNGPLRIILGLLGVSVGAVQVFFGHIENYPFGILTSTLFLAALYLYMDEEIGTLGLLLLYVLAFKAHIIAILFLPAVVVAVAYHYRNELPKLQSMFTWRSVLMVVILPALLIGLLLYVFVFHSWNEPYALSNGRQFQQTFLPILSLPKPLDHYSLWSPYHFADFLNVLLLTSAPIVVLLATLFVFNRKEISWSQPTVIVFGLAALFPFIFFMAMNPTLSPVRDWDVFTLLVPPLLFFASILMVQSGMREYGPAWLGQSVVFGVLFTTVLIAVNYSPLELQRRLQDAGDYTYRSYYAGASYIEARSFALDDTATAVPTHYAEIVEELSRGSVPGKDQELSNMMSRLGSFYGFIGSEGAAIHWADAARKMDTSNGTYVSDLARYYVQANRLQEASAFLKGIVKSGKAENSRDLAEIMAQLGARYSRVGDDTSTVEWAVQARKSDPRNLQYFYDLADYYIQTKRPLQALDELRGIPPDSVSVETLTATALASANAYGPDSGLQYLYRAKALAPNDHSVDSLILEMSR